MADDAVARAMQAVPRTGFLPHSQRPFAGADHPLPIGQGQTSSQPSTVADMLRLLRVPRRARVLDIGAGSGWTTALLAHLTGPDGEVLGVERHARLAEWGAENVAATGMGWARVEPARPGMLGAPRPDGWDRILVSATANRLPRELVDQLAPGGLMVIPVRGRMLLVERHANGDVRVSEHGGYRFVPLVEN
ncbi:protein-L-isoaspartate O-methyltransferase family protein [Myceligenerans pegani]|uniref:Protein-L-isoaspartate O-methyltransferase n=1 Tax=Myceligenerans pegani TaxID=2776917 RepID=A0ABR9N1P1_9MICO|nr:protein-L-isoaspartate carboxylmethyltransferase [Myceligenerans sp. TRM 65318]MBE1877577.1 protein-L-isoaspartate carboxylmethyltransferase [Myceligenerans sp. TRM 65318]MBE3019848.1 protein-L-isoaspartate carboxylmethyltransferase [Myceligenerans sp. TRM 65318]